MKGLIARYYIIYVLLLALFACVHFFTPQIELTPDNAYIASVVCIFFLFTIPATLKLFSVKTKGNKKQGELFVGFTLFWSFLFIFRGGCNLFKA